MAEPRIIKKYPNRRLYDTQRSCYITLDDIRELVVHGDDFRIIDKRSDDDITHSILLQVISEQEQSGDPIFSTEALRRIIRFYGDSMQGTMSAYLELSLELFNEQQHQFRDRLHGMLGANRPLAALQEMSRQQEPIWRSVRREYLRNLSGAEQPEPGDETTTP